ncbi:MAG: hypothetical protein FJY10_03315 [Bacteroidetes bacterium]|nr:hypothetical protein [Bacteroidota bacterium]
MNQIRENTEQPQVKSNQEEASQGSTFGRRLAHFLGGEYLSRDRVKRFYPFLIYLAFLCILYISNTYYAEKTIRKISRTKSQIDELTVERIAVMQQLQTLQRASYLAEKLKNSGIREATVPPEKLFFDESETGLSEQAK